MLLGKTKLVHYVKFENRVAFRQWQAPVEVVCRSGSRKEKGIMSPVMLAFGPINKGWHRWRA